MEQNVLEQILEGSVEPTYLPLETLREITDGFSTNRIIGKGGFGTVYKGIVGNRNVAVKRITSSMTIDDKLFHREVNSLMEVNHQNVVRFLGLCSHTVETPMKIPESRGYIFAEIRERLLCFEYISNGSLDKRITDELRGLEWDTRYKIIKGICTGLHYLHMEKRILHMDLKPANILLDIDMVPKITDFGLSRPTESSKTVTTTHFASPGYCAPENFFRGGRMSVQSDMYSLGVIIIELVTGHKGVPDSSDNTLRRWRHRWKKSAKETAVKYHDQVTICIEIGSLCQKVDPYARPCISEIMSKFVELESMDNGRMISHEPTVGQITVPYWEDDMLGVEPLELQFVNSEDEKHHILSCSVELSNDTDSSIAFKIQTTSPLPYSIEPNKDIVKPRSKCSVDITLPEANTQEHNNNWYTKEFIVRSIKLNEGLTTNYMNEDMFDESISHHHVDEIYLSVISEETFNKEVTDSPTKQAKQYASSGQGSSTAPQDVINFLGIDMAERLTNPSWDPSAAACLISWAGSDGFDRSDFEPSRVCIGPFHRGKQSDLSEKMKRDALHRFLPGGDQELRQWELDRYLQAMGVIEPRVRQCYSCDCSDITPDEFKCMLLLDGCFLHTRLVRAATQPLEDDILVDRDIFFLLENQLPFFVLEEIHKLITPDAVENSDVVVDIVLGRVEALLRRSEYSAARVAHQFPTPPGPPCLLHLLHMHFCPEALGCNSASTTRTVGRVKHNKVGVAWSSATYYRAAGIKFKPRKVGRGAGDARSILDVKLRGSTLHVPCLTVDSNTFGMLRNMVALEQQSSSKCLSMSHVTTYCFFLSQLAATEKDVELLVAKKILMHVAGDTKELAEGLAGLCDGTAFNPADPGRSYLSTCQDALETLSKARSMKSMALFWKRRP